MFDGFAYKYLQDRLHLVLVVKEVWVTLEDLRGLRLALGVRYKDCRRRPVNVVIGWNFLLRNKIITITEFLPIVCTRHLLHLNVLVSFFFALALSLPFLYESTLTHLFLTLFHVGLFHTLFFNEGWIGLHVDRNDECGKGVATDNTTIIHDVLRGHLNVLSVRIPVLLLTHNLRLGCKSVTSHGLLHLHAHWHLTRLHHLLLH